MRRITSPQGREAVATILQVLAGAPTEDLVAEVLLRCAGLDAGAADRVLEIANREIAEQLTIATPPLKPRMIQGITIAVIETVRARLAEVNALGIGQA